MPFLSIIVPTMRVGGLNVLLDSLQRQTFTDFELVLVDGLASRRAAIVDKEAKDRFLCVRHVSLDPNPFPVAAFCRYSNAGIAVSTGEVLLFAVDYTRFGKDTLLRHAMFHKADPSGKGGLMGPHRYIHLDVHPEFPRYGHDPEETARYVNDVQSGALDRWMWSIGKALDQPALPHDADGGASVPHDADPKLRHAPGRIGPEYFHAKNESVRRERVIEVDGYDQELDGAHLYQDSDFADRLTLKAGVQWLLDPAAVVEIANPRHVFPYAKRLRPHEENRVIWQRKKAAGYPAEAPRLVPMKMKEREVGALPQVLTELAGMRPRLPEETDEQARARRSGELRKKLRVVMIYGEFSSHGHGPYDVEGLYTRMGLTGSEGSFFNLMRSLAERGHEVVAFCDCPAPAIHASGAHVMPIAALPALQHSEGVDAVIAWNEPDYLRFAPPGARRYCDQQLNDFGYCRHPQWRELVDVWVSPSENHRQNVMPEVARPGAQLPSPVVVIPNSVDLDLFAGPAPVREPHTVVWCSSPDRGLHHLLSFWPDVRIRVPDAKLKVFYRLAPWLARARENGDEVGRRARYIEEVLPRLASRGVEVVDLVPNAVMARELRSAAVLAYPCDPVRYTEGFGCSVLDAAAGGCVPIISAADALPEVHGSAAIGIAGPPQQQRAQWVEAICAVLQGEESPEAIAAMKAHAELHSRHRVADQWERLLLR